MKSANFSDYLDPTHIIYDLKAEVKIEALEELLTLLEDQKLIKNKKPVLTRVIDRERLETTGIGHGVALPHARINTGHDIAIVVGRSEQGIDFDAIDGRKVYLIILIIWNPSIPGLFNHLFAGLAKFLIKQDFRNRLFNAKSGEELYLGLSEIKLVLPQGQDKILHRGGLLWKLQEIEIRKRKAKGKDLDVLEKKAELIRGELDSVLLDRFDRLMGRYGFAVAEFDDGACQGCYINVATGMGSAIVGSNDIYVCENCGKFLVAAQKEKK